MSGNVSVHDSNLYGSENMTNVDRQAALDLIRQNIAERGFHLYSVVGGGCPHYSYTIGLSESHGAELVLAGAYFYQLDQAPEIMKGIVRELISPVEWGSFRVRLDGLGTFTLQKVHLSWAKHLMLGAFDYYDANAIEAYQVIPDEAHQSIEIPSLSQPWSPNAEPAWRWLVEEWPYSVPADSVALTDFGALNGERITEVVRWEEDEWEMFAGAGPDIPDAEKRIVPLGMLLGIDSSLTPVVNLSIGEGLWRDAESEWHTWVNRE